MNDIDIGIIGGSGIYEIEELENVQEHHIETPFGAPSDDIIVGELYGKKVAFLARHSRNHSIAPSEINNRANIYALKLLGVKYLISVSAVGSMKEEIHPTDIVIPDQIFDRTKTRVNSFFGEGIVAHVSFDEPFCPHLGQMLVSANEKEGCRVHDGGTYICIEGPQFSTKAESRIYRSWGVDVIGMTAIPEAKLAREAEMCYGTIALSTDYDVWKEGEEVSVATVVGNLKKNAANAKKIVKRVIKNLPFERECKCATALQYAIQTKKEAIPEQKKKELAIFISKYL